MIVQHFPNRTIVQSSTSVNRGPFMVCRLAVVIRFERHILHLVVLSSIFCTSQKAAVVISKKIKPLVPCYLTGRTQKSSSQLPMFLVTATFLPLSKISIMDVINCMLYATSTFTIFKIFNPFIINSLIVTQHTDGNQCSNVIGIPISPMVIDTCTIVVYQEIEAYRIKVIDHHILKSFEVVLLPSFIDSHNFGSHG